ncbi:Hypothetical protein FKW44_007678 [Caligus rogercresseyi]|uniref:Uncharacterized protein n=1 Tax=Caligus rogercresseyi TaxID=217165 RepID=A0A7T8KF30_CALRO|nr:Hypothetical protein FKW44_007678 [Caligus rogercresseyi]
MSRTSQTHIQQPIALPRSIALLMLKVEYRISAPDISSTSLTRSSVLLVLSIGRACRPPARRAGPGSGAKI